jgi:glycosyltransferase involved in cell wall biosynthesis
MRVAYLFGSLKRGGTETLMLDVFKNASQAVFSFIGIYRISDVLEPEFIATRQPFIRLTPHFPFDPLYLFRLRKLLKKEQVDIAHAQFYLDAIYAWLACLGTKIKVIQTFHGYNFQKGKLADILTAFIIKRVKNIFVSHAQKAYFVKKYKLSADKQSVVYNGISFNKLIVPAEKNTPLFVDLKKDELLLGSVGNFVPVRDQLTICKFLFLLYQQGVSFRFVFVGAPSDATPWLYNDCVNFCKENGLTDKVYFLGSRNDVPSILSQLDAFIYSTDHDTFGIAVIEAIAMAVPVFVNDWEVMLEVTDNGNYATLYRTKQAEDLLEKFMDFLKNKTAYCQKASQAAKSVRTNYSIKEFMVCLHNQYLQLDVN